jgi:glutathione S-transferase
MIFWLIDLYPLSGEVRCLEWMNFLSSSVQATAFSQIWRPLRFVNEEKDTLAVRAKGKQCVSEQYA